MIWHCAVRRARGLGSHPTGCMGAYFISTEDSTSGCTRETREIVMDTRREPIIQARLRATGRLSSWPSSGAEFFQPRSRPGLVRSNEEGERPREVKRFAHFLKISR